ncbi:MAG: DUF2281 domain-containing protein [Anaerolineae bacterium]|nr:DUF2281 domain-containing protein [Anaerolineae bacterium]
MVATTEQAIADIVRQLSPTQQDELYEYAQTLLEQQRTPKRKYLSQSWAGGLRDLRDQYTSLELQKKALEWWAESD